MTESRVMPARTDEDKGGVTRRPFFTIKMFSPEPSLT